VESLREAEEQARREREVQELLDKPRVMEEGRMMKGGVERVEDVTPVGHGTRS